MGWGSYQEDNLDTRDNTRDNIGWVRDESWEWFLLDSLSVDVLFMDCHGVYIIWYFDENDIPVTVRTGVKGPNDHLIMIRKCPTVEKYADRCLYITWTTKLESYNLERIWAYLCKNLNPLEPPRCCWVRDPLPINLPNEPPRDFHQDPYWGKLSYWYREECNWRCECCGIDLQQKGMKEFLHTHHIRGTAYNNPDDLKALCISCHSDQKQPRDHSRMQKSPKYKEFMRWRG